MLEREERIFPKLCLKKALFLLLLCFCLRITQANPVFKIYPLADDYFEKIYFLNHQAKSYYLSINCKEKDMLSISISEEFTFQEAPRFNIYGNLKNLPKMGRGIYTFLKECNAQVEVDNQTNFLEVRRNDTQKLIFALADLAFRDMHAKFTVRDQSVKWGLGQRFQRHFEVTDGSWTLWNRDRPWKIDDGRKGDSQQTYGHQPVYLARQKQGLYHLVYFKNTHGLLVESQQETNELVFNSVGGTLHFIILLGYLDPEPLLKRYHDYIGHSHIPPFWSLGYHQCRWGYRTLQDLIEVIKQFNKHDLPIDSIWSDLEYMNKKMIFTINELTHPSKKLSQLLVGQELHFIPLMDVGVSLQDLPAVTMGKKMDVFLKNPGKPNECYVGHVWPGQVHFVDYLHPNASDYWKLQLKRLHQSVNFSGMWLDMNEPANFRGGEVTTEPFRIQNHQNINTMTINVDLNHHTESHHEQLKHRQVHAYYGHLSTIPTFEFLSEKGRPFIISRSNSVGSGVFAGHWTGDNVANWQFLRSSINANFLYQIFGMQMVGADICGFYRDTTQQLCARWMQLGALYPFARNHNHLESISQEPYSFSDILLQTSRISLKFRYSFLRHMYSLMIHQKGRGSFFRPLTFQFYSDEFAYEEETIQTQFLIGRFLLVAPIVYDSATQRSVYFPGQEEQWFEFMLDSKTGQVKMESIVRYAGQTSSWISNQLPNPPPTFLRAGFMLLTTQPANRSIKLPKSFHILAALKSNEAVGEILGIDDYNYQPHIAKCIEDICHYTIKITKAGDKNFTLSWKYDGNINIRSNISIQSIQMAFLDQRWRNSEKRLLNAVDGSIIFEAEEVFQ